jgi:hypothetical protein
VVVVVPPGIEHEAGMRQRREERLVEAFVVQAGVDGVDGPCARYRCAILVAMLVHLDRSRRMQIRWMTARQVVKNREVVQVEPQSKGVWGSPWG